MTSPAKIRAAAQHAHELGFTVLPIRDKRPHFGALQAALGHAKWSALRGRPWAEVEKCFAGGGFAGKVEGWAIEWNESTACFDFDDAGVWKAFEERCRAAGHGELLRRCVEGYSVRTPRGMRFAVRCEAGIRSGPLAYRAAPEGEVPAEGGEGERRRRVELIGLKGRGGYTVEAPSYGSAHPSGKRYGPQRGRLETIAVLRVDEVQTLLDVAVGLDETGVVARVQASPPVREVRDDGSGRITASHRWSPRLPCPICGGVQKKGAEQGHCYGYQHPSLPLVVYCTETGYAGARQTENGAWLHRVGGRCPCGQYHGERVGITIVEETDEEGKEVKREVIVQEDLRALRYLEDVGLTMVVGDQNRFVWRTVAGVVRQSKQAAGEALRGKTVRIVEADEKGGFETKVVSAFAYWFSRISDEHTAYGYTYTDTAPHFHIHKGKLNLWRGEASPAVEAPEAVARFLAHLERACSARKPLLAYLLDYVAWHVQNPTRKSDVAVFLYGAPGTGKNTITYALSKLWHPEHTVELHDDAILQAGGFNAISDGAALLVLDEAVFLRSPRDMNKLKTLITADRRVINAKYQPEYRIENMLTVFLLSNHPEIRMESNDRRYLVLEMDPTLAGDHAHFDALYEEIESPGFAGALLHWGRSRKLPRIGDAAWTPARALKLLTHEEQQLAREGGLSVGALWTRALVQGHILPWVEGQEIPWETVHAGVSQWLLAQMGRISDGGRQGPTQEHVRSELHPLRFSRTLRQMLGWEVKNKGRLMRNRIRAVVPGSRKAACARWFSATGVEMTR